MLNSLSVSAIKDVGKEHYNDVIMGAMAPANHPSPLQITSKSHQSFASLVGQRNEFLNR